MLNETKVFHSTFPFSAPPLPVRSKILLSAYRILFMFSDAFAESRKRLLSSSNLPVLIRGGFFEKSIVKIQIFKNLIIIMGTSRETSFTVIDTSLNCS